MPALAPPGADEACHADMLMEIANPAAAG